MWFNILTHNHGDMSAIESLSPLINYFKSTLSLSGHDVTVVYDQIYPDAVNIYFEHFLNAPRFAEQFRTLRRDHGVQIGVIATELMVKGGIPYSRHGISGATPQYLRDRMNGFHAILPEIDFLWSLLGRTADEYKQRVKLCEFFPVGHAPGFGPGIAVKAPKDLPAVFFGKLTPHRKQVLEGLMSSGIKVVAAGRGFPMGWQAAPLTESLLERARIGLNLTLHAEAQSDNGIDPRFVSCFRVVEMLERGILVVSEEIPLDNPYGPYMASAPIGGLPDLCRNLLAGDGWAEMAQDNAARFRRDMDVRTLCAPVIERTLAGLNKGKSARR